MKMDKIVEIMDSAINRLNDIRDKLHNHSEENMAINIILDCSDSQNPIFVEIENDDGKSICIGEELVTSEGFRKLRINTSDIISHEKT
jgi:hypothetical protein